MKRKRGLQFAIVFLAAVLPFSGCWERPAQSAVTVGITPDSAVMTVGETRTFQASASDGSKIGWTTDNALVASVDGAGKVTALSSGNVSITATAEGSGASASCFVTVEAATVLPPADPDPEKPDPTDPDPTDPEPTEPQWELSWSDEFNGDVLDETKWSYQLGVQDDYYGIKGPSFWGNNEQQYYTREAVSLENGALKITAARAQMPNGRNFSSARLITRDKYSFTYGYAEARMKTPAIEGMWPAFWALPQPMSHSTTQNKYGGWPYSGEIDIMEAQGRRKNIVGTTLHFGGRPGQWQSTYLFHDTVLSSSTEEWHTYGLDWRESYLAWYIDGEEVFRVDNKTYWTGAVSKEQNPNAPFDEPFYLLLDLAVGGNYDGGREPPASFTSAAMYVDYVRVYRPV